MKASLTSDQKPIVFERMLRMRRFEETVVRMSKEGHPFGHFHLYIGQEATGAAAMEALAEGDTIFSTHRNHGHLIARGADPGRCLAEILGRATGLNGGRGGTLHLCDSTLGFLTTSAVVGGSLPMAAGTALTAKMRDNGLVTAAFFGDGALEEGVAFEAFNMAALWNLPVVYICENNSPGALGQAAGEYSTSMMATTKLARIPESVGIPTRVVDGNDPDAVFEAVSEAVNRCRQGKGPGFIEAITPRWAGSRPLWPELTTGVTELAMVWDETRISGEHAEWYRTNDPVLRAARELLKGETAPGELEALDEQVRRQMDAAARFAAESPAPRPETFADHIFA
ncbi:MAG: thiamine pyrophosphate-dependent dehydrogenase E1 component subunit alpha [bacterium]